LQQNVLIADEFKLVWTNAKTEKSKQNTKTSPQT
jgi:hypothetical protein